MKGIGVESAIYFLNLHPKPALLSDVALSAMLAGRAVRDGFDALIFHQGQAASGLFKSVRTVCYFHQVKYDDLAGGGIVPRTYKGFLAAIERHITHAVCNSEYVASRIRILLPRAHTVKVVYPGRSLQDVLSGEPKEEDFCYCHSRFHPRKNQMFLLSVLEGLSCKLYLTGGTWDRNFRSYQSNLMQRTSRMTNVNVLTDVSDATYGSLLSRSRVFLFPALEEPFGLVLLDAMAFGKPIIAMNSGASPEILGDAGILCGRDIGEWQCALSELLTNRDLRVSLSNRCLLRIGNFSWDRTAKELIDIIESA
jgi:glycosyltransferase involved in cell wall biosynthesis